MRQSATPSYFLTFISGVALSFMLLVTSSPVFAQVTLVTVDKSKRRMYLYDHSELIRTFRIALGKYPKGHKRRLGDQRTPEGKYVLDHINYRSRFYKSFHISYPNQQDRQAARQSGVSPGGAISIHGLKNGTTYPPDYINSFDWTNGCIAVSNQAMDEIIRLVPVGTPIHIEW